MSKAEMSVHYIKPDSLRFERQNLRSQGKQFTVVDLFCETEEGDEFQLKMFMDETSWRAPVSVDIGDAVEIKGLKHGQPEAVRLALKEYLEHLDACRDDASANGRLDEMQSCIERGNEIRLLIGDEDTEGGGTNDGAQDQDQEQG